MIKFGVKVENGSEEAKSNTNDMLDETYFCLFYSSLENLGVLSDEFQFAPIFS